MTAKNPELRTLALNRETDNLVARVSEANRAFVADFIRYRRNKGLKAGSVRMVASALAKADKVLGVPFGEASPERLAGMIEALRSQQLSEAYLANISVHLRSAWKRMMGTRELPRPIYEALEVREPQRVVHGKLVPDDAFNALLEGAAASEGATSTLHRAPMIVALLWLLRDSGFRIGEALSLRFADIVFDEQGARLSLNPKAEGLKTGPRTVYVARCAPVLRAWMDLHPANGQLEAPIFIGLRNRDGLAPLRYLTFERLLGRLCVSSGVSQRVGALTPHDFRHTRATEVARNREMSEEQMRVYFGWRPGSKMPSTYIHLSLGDMKDAVLKAAQIAPTGHALPRVEVGVGPDELTLLRNLKKLLQG